MTLTQHQWRGGGAPGTAANWAAANPVLLSGEPGFESDTGKFKVGNGVDNWNSLEYFQDANSTLSVLQSQIDILGPRLLTTVTASDTFEKADYPWLKYVWGRGVGGGAGGGGCANSTASNSSFGSGGGSGAYFEFLAAVTDLAPVESMIIGLGGLGHTNADGSDGDETSFGGFGSGPGGLPGVKEPNDNVAQFTLGGTPGGIGLGDFTAGGVRGGYGIRIGGAAALGGRGAASHLGGGGAERASTGPGNDGSRGGGGGGAVASGGSGTADKGGDGGDGRIILVLFG